MKIMIIDDSLTMLKTVVLHLEKLGHQTVSSTNPNDALQMFLSEDPDLVILDVVMKGTSGYDVAKRIRALKNHDWVPIIFLSSNVSDDAVAQGIEAGGDDYLTKPFSEITLQAKISAMDRIASMRQELIEANKQLEKLSSTDTLTGIPNRMHFEKTIRKSIAQAKRNHTKFVIFYIDLDNFKNTNDTLGHQFGDLLLKYAVERMTNISRESDFLARIGGDEFAMITYDVSSFDDAAKIAHKLIHAFRSPFILEDNKVSSSLSIGIAIYPDHGSNIETLIKNVDMAMYKAKESGKNNFQCYDESITQAKMKQNRYETELRYALNNDEFHIEFQPKFNLLTGEIVGVESLLRWHNPTLGDVSPDVFIPIAERTGLIHSIGKWVLESCCQQLYIWQQESTCDFRMAINLSPKQLMKPDLAKHVDELLATYEINPDKIEFEITETAIMSGDEISEKLLKRFNELGITLTIDDFGTGFSSLIHIKRLPIKALKIDKTFVVDIPKDENDIAIVKSVISLSDSLKLNVVAEGIETEEQKQFLLEHGCTIGQGFHLSMPLKSDELIQLIKLTNNCS